VAPHSFADSLRERLDLVARHPGRNPDHKRSGLEPLLSAVGVNNYIILLCHIRKYFLLYNKNTLWMIYNFVNYLIISATPGMATGGCERGLKRELAGICSSWDAEVWMNIYIF